MTDSARPTQPLTGATHDTTGDLVPPGATTHEPQWRSPEQTSAELAAYYQAEVGKLTSFLSKLFPDELGRTNYQVEETAVDVAIRLLVGLQAGATAPDFARCPEDYCNQSYAHLTPHGMVSFG